MMAANVIPEKPLNSLRSLLVPGVAKVFYIFREEPLNSIVLLSFKTQAMYYSKKKKFSVHQAFVIMVAIALGIMGFWGLWHLLSGYQKGHIDSVIPAGEKWIVTLTIGKLKKVFTLGLGESETFFGEDVWEISIGYEGADRMVWLRKANLLYGSRKLDAVTE